MYFNNIKNSGVKGVVFKHFISQAVIFNFSYLYTISDCYFVENGSIDSRVQPAAIRIVNSTNGNIKGNFVGVDPQGNETGNNAYGIVLSDFSDNNTIGGTNLNEGNVIVKNYMYGLWITKGSRFNKVSGNIIYGQERAIVLTEGNNMKQAPVIHDYNSITSELRGVSEPDDIIEIFGSAGNEHANVYLGTTITDAHGDWIASNISTTYDYLVATATDGQNNTSNLSLAFQKLVFLGSTCENSVLLTPDSNNNFLTFQLAKNQAEYWFSFIANDTNIYVILKDTSDNNGNYLCLYEGNCDSLNLISHGSIIKGLISEISFTGLNLVIGKTYYLKYIKKAVFNSLTTFELCVQNIDVRNITTNCIPDHWINVSTGMNGTVFTLLEYNGVLYAGGSFISADGNTVNNIAQWNGNNWISVGGGITGSNAQILSMAVYNGELYVGGDFTTAGGIPANNIAKWNGSNWSNLGSGIQGNPYWVYSLKVYNGELFVGGIFSIAGGIPANSIAKWNGTNWSITGTGTGNMLGMVASLDVFNGELYAGGQFNIMDGISVSNIAKWNGSNWSALGSGVSGSCLAIKGYNNELYAGGLFTYAGGIPVNNIAKWNGSNWSLVSLSGASSIVQTFSEYNGDLYVGGNFQIIGGIQVDYVAKWDGSNFYSVDNGIGSYAFSLEKCNNELYVGGSFYTAGSVSAMSVAKLCPPLPVASFTVGSTSVCVGQSVSFVDQSTGFPTSWSWYFPGGTPSSSSLQNPFVTYNTPGIYNVSLTVSNSDGSDTHTEISYIVVNLAPQLTATVTSTCNSPCTGTATIVGVGGSGTYSYQWPGLPSNTTGFFNNLCLGDFMVTVTDNNGCSVIDIITIPECTEPPTTRFIFNNHNNIEEYPVTFTIDPITYNAGTSYTWDFMDGTIITSNNQTVDYTFIYPGYYQVTLTATNCCGTYTTSQIIYIIPNQGTYSPTPSCLSSFVYDYDNVMITTPTSGFPWDSGNLITISGTLRITLGGSLTVSNGTTVAFGPEGKVVVDREFGYPRSTLILDNAIFTGITFNNCNGQNVKMMWQGIEVYGYSNSSLQTKQGKIVLQNNSIIEDAYNGVILGKSLLGIFGNGFSYNGHDASYGGGIIQATTNSTFNRCAVGIKFWEYPFANAFSYISSCNFFCKERIGNSFGNNTSLLDPYFVSVGGIDEYDNHIITEHNPFYSVNFSPSALGRSLIGIDLYKRRNINIRDCNFEYSEAGVYGSDGQFNIIRGSGLGNTFTEHTYGIRIANTASGIFGHTFSNNSFHNAYIACLVWASRNDLFLNNKFNPNILPQITNNGIALNFTTNYSIIDNAFLSNMYAIMSYNSLGMASLIGYQNGGNVFSRCFRPISTWDDNSMLNIRCNNFDNSISADYGGKNWNIHGMFPDQGQAGTGVQDPAGNLFNVTNPSINKEIEANSNFFYYYSHTDLSTIPDKFSQASSFDIPQSSTILTNISDACAPTPSCNPNCNLQIMQNLQSLNTQLLQDYINMQSNIDNNQTDVLLSAIMNNLPIYSLKDMLINNSPLSDEVLSAFINRTRPISPVFFEDVLSPNSPVSNTVYPDLMNKLATMPPPFANRIKQKQVVGSNTLTSIQRQITANENQRQLILNEVIKYYLDNDLESQAILLLEQETSKVTKQALVGTYIENGNYPAALTKLTSLPVNTPGDIAFRDLYQLYIDLGLQQKTLWDMDSIQFQMVRNIAAMCPASLATINAQAVLLNVTGEKFEPCSDAEINVRMYNTNGSYIEADMSNIIGSIEYLGNNIPNPFKNSTFIPYFIPEGSKGYISVTDVNGKLVKKYELNEGSNQLEVTLENYSNGMYFYTLNIDDGRIVCHKKMIYNK